MTAQNETARLRPSDPRAGTCHSPTRSVLQLNGGASDSSRSFSPRLSGELDALELMLDRLAASFVRLSRAYAHYPKDQRVPPLLLRLLDAFCQDEARKREIERVVGI